jgi:hypothetical protein
VRQLSITRIILIFILFNIFAESAALGIIGSTGTTNAHSDKTSFTQTDISKGSTGSTTHYIQSIQERENIYVESYLLGKDEFNIDDDIIIQFRIRNELDKPIYCENIHIPIAIEFYNKTCNPPKTAYWYPVADGISIMPSETHHLDEEKKIKGILIPSYDSIIFNYTIRSKITRPYILPQAIITFTSGDSRKKLYSAPLYLRVIDSYPEIISITLSPTPLIDTNNISFDIKFKDMDKNETMDVQVWSNIDDILPSNYTIKQLDNTCYYQANFKRKLSLGTQLLTFRINDSHDGFVEKEMIIDVKQDSLHQYLQLYAIAFIIMLCSLINVWNILDHEGLLAVARSIRRNLFAVALMIVSFIILFVLPIYLLAALYW